MENSKKQFKNSHSRTLKVEHEGKLYKGHEITENKKRKKEAPTFNKATSNIKLL